MSISILLYVKATVTGRGNPFHPGTKCVISDVQNLLVIVTDGESNISPHNTLPEARRLKAMGVTIVTVAIGVTDNSELRGLTSPPVDKNLIEVTDFNALHKISELIVAPLCTGKINVFLNSN